MDARMEIMVPHNALRNSQTYFIIYHAICYAALRLILPLGALIVLNVRLVATLNRERANHARLTNNPRQRRNFSDSTNALLVAMITLFLACQLPDAFIRVVGIADKLREHSNSTADDLISNTTIFPASNETRFNAMSNFNHSSNCSSDEGLVVRLSSVTYNEAVEYGFCERVWASDTDVFSFISVITNLMLTVNSAANCLVYCLARHRFRLTLKRLICSVGVYRGRSREEASWSEAYTVFYMRKQTLVPYPLCRSI